MTNCSSYVSIVFDHGKRCHRYLTQFRDLLQIEAIIKHIHMHHNRAKTPCFHIFIEKACVMHFLLLLLLLNALT